LIINTLVDILSTLKSIVMSIIDREHKKREIKKNLPL